MFDFSREAILSILYALPAIFFCLSIHEFAHGYVAYKLGDPTARNLGRLTLNPVKHIDPFGIIALLFVRFGWAKPVPVNTRYFKKPKRDMALTALAGPLSNIISAFVFSFLYALVLRLYLNFLLSSPAFNEKTLVLWEAVISIVQNFVFINISLAVFNLIPIPPLDGSKILDIVLPTKVFLAYHKYEQYISMALMILLVATNVFSPFIRWATESIAEILFYIPQKVFLS